MKPFSLPLGLSLLTLVTGCLADNHNNGQRKRCVVKASGTNLTDDAPAIRDAFDQCGCGGNVVFSPNTTYYVNSILNITGLKDCQIDVYGTLLWSTNITYWLNASLPVGYQNQSTAFILGGDSVTLDGHGTGTLDGNGNYWYSFIHGKSNYPGRPHQITFNGLRNSVVKRLNFLRSQMWTMSIIQSDHVLLEDIYVNNTSTGGSTSSNTDGADTFFSSFITFNRWVVVNGDDSISAKANSTDIYITNSTFYNGLGVAIGSIGQYLGQFETIERVYAKDLVFYNTLHAIYFKTWTGDQVGYPPNGGGGGLGYASDLHFSNLTSVTQYRGVPLVIGQCTSFNGVKGNCTDSKFQIRDISFANLSGPTDTSKVASFQCSAEAPCENITITGAEMLKDGAVATTYLCQNVVGTIGWNCTGSV